MPQQGGWIGLGPVDKVARQLLHYPSRLMGDYWTIRRHLGKVYALHLLQI
jgi:hypothetical protein